MFLYFFVFTNFENDFENFEIKDRANSRGSSLSLLLLLWSVDCKKERV